MYVYCQEWFDERLVWNANEFENITELIVGTELLWVPDVVLINR